MGRGFVTMLSDTRGINELVRRAGIGSGLLQAPSIHITGPILGMGSDGMLLLGPILALTCRPGSGARKWATIWAPQPGTPL